MAYEIIINGDPLDTIDPIWSVKIVINNGAHDYEYTPDQLQSLQVREMEEPGQ